ncbi:hypothetical protein UlMin_027953 [Ulmus minor]
MTVENGDSNSEREEQEESLVLLIEHRSREVQNLRHRVTYYQAQLEEAEKRLHDTQSKLARLRGRTSSKKNEDNGIKSVKEERKSISPVRTNECSSSKPSQSKPELRIPAVTPKFSRPITSSGSKVLLSSNARTSPVVTNARTSPVVTNAQTSPVVNTVVKAKGDKSVRTSDHEIVQTQDRGTKRKFEQKEHRELIPLIRRSSSPCKIRCETSNHISSQHKRKMRTISLCPVNDQQFVTSALDGMVNLWQVQSKGCGASVLIRTDCVSDKQRRWPEDIAWHPDGNSLFAVYSADDGDSQVSVMDLNRTQGRARVNFLEHKPHSKGIINNIMFMPWEDACFVTGGCDHAVMFWKEKDNVWKPKTLHRSYHSSAVMGVAGMQQKHIVLSVGADKKIIGFDATVERADFKHQIESKCMSVLPNPCDYNLFMVQTGTPERQLRLYDIRLRQTEIHAFGWKQESSESQSALINQSWSPDGMYITSGSADPMIHIFDIRYDAHKPSQSIKAHQKRVFKAVWLQSIPLLVSISSDLNVGLHKII